MLIVDFWPFSKLTKCFQLNFLSCFKFVVNFCFWHFYMVENKIWVFEKSSESKLFDSFQQVRTGNCHFNCPYFFPNSLSLRGNNWVFDKSPRSKLFDPIQQVRIGYYNFNQTYLAQLSKRDGLTPAALSSTSSHISYDFSGNSFGTSSIFGEFNSFFPFLLSKLKLTFWVWGGC